MYWWSKCGCACFCNGASHMVLTGPDLEEVCRRVVCPIHSKASHMAMSEKKSVAINRNEGFRGVMWGGACQGTKVV